MDYREWWRDLRLHTKGLLVVAVPAAATVILALGVYALGTLSTAEEKMARQSLQFSREIQRQRAAEAELSALVRGYFVTGDEKLVDKIRAAVEVFDFNHQTLARFAAGDPVQTLRLAQIAVLERSNVERIFDAIGRARAGVITAEDLRADVRGSEIERQRTRSILAAADAEENSSMKTRFQAMERLARMRHLLVAGCVFLGVVGGVVISLMFATGITRRIGKLQENVSKLATGGVLDSLPGGRDEIGTLSEDIARTAETLRRRTAALENALHGIAEADASGWCLSYNKAYAELTGCPEGCDPVNILATLHPDDRPKVEAALVAMRANGLAELEARIMHRQGYAIDVAMTLLPTSEDPDSGYYVFLHDTALRKETEAALVLAKDAAVASNLAKTQFLAKVGHDIRTPLNAILGAADLLSQSPLNADQSGYVKMFQRNCRRLAELINDFLDFSRIEAGAVQVQRNPTQIRDALQDAVVTFREPAARKGLELCLEVDPNLPEWVMVDGGRVQQVLVNLISNAIKFTRQGGVYVAVQPITGPQGAQIRFEVRDTGAGIGQQDQARIFAAFEQLPDPDKSNQGSGLGLAICRELVELMGGTIDLTSHAGFGSTFQFTLPLEAAAPPAADPPGAGDPSFAGQNPGEPPLEELRILIAEDTADNRLLLEHYLRDQSLKVTFAVNGQEAFEESKRNEYDLIFMDIDMPVLDGYQTTKAIRDWQTANDKVATPIVALSAHAMREAVRASLDSGCTAHVAKPVDRPTLLKTIQRYALSKSMRAQAAPVPNEVADGVASLVPTYLASKPKQIEDARSSLAQHDFEPVQRFGHNLKGTGGGYGFPRIQEIGTEIERAAMAQDEESIRRQLEALYRLVTDESAARNLSGTLTSGSSPAVFSNT